MVKNCVFDSRRCWRKHVCLVSDGDNILKKCKWYDFDKHMVHADVSLIKFVWMDEVKHMYDYRWYEDKDEQLLWRRHLLMRLFE